MCCSLLRKLQCKCSGFVVAFSPPPLGISIICVSFSYLAAKSPVTGYICCNMLCAVSLLPLPTQNPWADTPCSIHSLLLTWQLWTERPLCKPSSCSTCTQVHQGWWYSTIDDAKATETSLKKPLFSRMCSQGEGCSNISSSRSSCFISSI